ncbi:MAG TPA: glycosyl hydrolase family 28 protein [Pseudomonadales bacterium]|nr:glycosyl hydrolase family 28 protein [Pseudomonadales bacterium]
MPNSDSSLSRRKWLGLTPTIAAASFGSTLLASRAMAQDTSASSGTDALLGAKVYNIRDFGAKGDGKTLDTPALQAAIDACHRDQGGTVLVPAGVFVIGTTELKSNVTLHIAAQGVLLGSTDKQQYFAADKIPLEGDSTLEDGNVGLLFAVNAENIIVEGPGTIDGQGAQFHSPQHGTPSPVGLSSHQRPYHLLFYRCKNVRVRDIFLKDCAYHSIRIIESSYAWFTGIHIHSRVNSNNDGFHFISTTHVHMSNCSVESQDDACALFGSCQNITITNCEFSTRWSVFRFGGGHAKDIAISNCLLYEVFGCPIKMRCGPRSRFERISFSNLVMRNVTGPISIGNGPGGRRQLNPGATGGTNSVSNATSPMAANTNAVPNTATNLYGSAPRESETSTNEPPPFVPVPDAEDLAAKPGICRNISFNGIYAIVSKPYQIPDAVVTSAYNPAEIFSCISLNGVAPASLQDIRFNDVHVIFPGGGTLEQGANRDVPKIADEYFRNGILPAYALFARGVHGLTLNNVRFEMDTPDLRPAVIFDHVTDAAVTGLNVQGQPRAESVLRFIESQDVLMTATRLLTPANVFLQVEGKNENITIDGGDLTKAATPVASKYGAGPEDVKVRG